MSHIKIDFAIVGQPKSGTTALAQFLSEHPDICMSLPKEPGYFATDLIDESDDFHGKAKYFPIRTAKQYDHCFSHKLAGQLTGEASTFYGYSKDAAKNVYRHNKNAKIIFILRNPADFVHSLHMQAVNAATEVEEDFSTALSLESKRKKGKNIPPSAHVPSRLFYRDFAQYSLQVERYLNIFPRENILILTNEEFKKNNKDAFAKVATFLDIDTTFSPNFRTVHGSKAVRFETLNRIIHGGLPQKIMVRSLPPILYDRLGKVVHAVTRKKQRRIPLPVDLRKSLDNYFMSDIKKTSELVGRDLVREWGLER